jgi:hypothetical protein
MQLLPRFMRRELDVEWKVGPGAEEGIERGVDHPVVQVGLAVDSEKIPGLGDLTTWFAFEGMMACFGGVGDEVSLAGEIFGA